MMQQVDIIEKICAYHHGIKPKSSWGETSLFYNPENLLPNGVYFCTLKDKDGDNDKASHLNRHDIYRFSLGLPSLAYEKLFGPKPARPAKGGIIKSSYDFITLDTLMPHPIYGWMGWVQILSPSAASFDAITPLIQESYDLAVKKYDKKIASRNS